ncbi:MAG: type III secretion system export apparatus subunit SctS [Puniceicoccales bacterium]|jgi:type III secretion HrpO family protein|nr:type III secretion system export apparatus subunit SctS [Puniceicoccales bacterium]
MENSIVLDFSIRAMILVLILSLPSILVATGVGLIVSLLQALTQIQEQTLGFTMKLISVVVVLLITARWIGAEVMQFTRYLFAYFPSMLH